MKRDFLRLVNISDARDGVLWVDHVHLRIARGASIAILGVEGSGKTSLSHLLSGRRSPTGGCILHEEHPIGPAALQEITGYIGRHSRLLESVSVFENLILANNESRILIPINRLRNEVRKLLCTFSLEAWLMVPVSQIPFFVQRQLLMIRAVLSGKRLIVLAGGGRQESSEELQPILSVIQKLTERGIAVVYTTDRLDFIAGALDETVLMRNGANVKRFRRGEWDESHALAYLYAQPLHRTGLQRGMENAGRELLLQDRLFSVYGGSVVHIYNSEHTNQTVFSYIASLCQIWRVPDPVFLGTKEVDSGWISSMDVLDNMLLAAAPKLANMLGHVSAAKKNMLRQECERAVQVDTSIWARRPYQLTRSERIRLQLFRYRLRGIRVIVANFNELDETDQTTLLHCAETFLDCTCAMLCVTAGAHTEGWIWKNGMMQGGNYEYETL